MWTHFWDMHSGGGQKLGWGHIFIETGCEEEARSIFGAIFLRCPDNVTCDCCGEDYSTSVWPDIFSATGFQRGCAHKEGGGYAEEYGRGSCFDYKPLSEYLKGDDALLVCVEDFNDIERHKMWREARWV